MSLAVPHGRDHRTGIVSGYSAPAAKQRNYCYADPMTAYDELFKSVTNPQAVESDNALLDYLREKESQRLRGLNGGERLEATKWTRLRQSRIVIQRSWHLGTEHQHLPKLDPVHAGGGPNATF